MALVKCPECNGIISSEAGKCPSCGKPLPTPLKKTLGLFLLIIMLGVFAPLLVILFIMIGPGAWTLIIVSGVIFLLGYLVFKKRR